MLLHHVALVVRDFDASLRFWRDGLGLASLMDTTFAGDWRTLFDADTDTLRSCFLGDPQCPDSGIVELVQFGGTHTPEGPVPGAPHAGLFLLSFNVDLDTTLARLADLGLGGAPREITVHGVRMVTVVDPDGVRVELIGLSGPPNLSGMFNPA